jgi:hypothetical protein
MVWFEIAPSFLSALASVAAAIAALVSLRISKRSTSIAESTALAIHHSSAALEYAKVVTNLIVATREFSDFSDRMWVQWARELEDKDNYELGGSNPRPLRHVLSNGCEMLANFGFYNASKGISARHAILYVIRNGIGSLSDKEYLKLLKKADGSYNDFESVFGIPSKSSAITSSPAFRWVCYQLIKRVKSEDWVKVWQEAWSENGWLPNYQTEYLKIKPILEMAQTSLKSEKSKLAHTTFPLSHNAELSAKYDEILKALGSLLEDCDGELLDIYKNWEFNEELSQLVLCSMATANFAVMQLNTIHKNDY